MSTATIVHFFALQHCGWIIITQCWQTLMASLVFWSHSSVHIVWSCCLNDWHWSCYISRPLWYVGTLALSQLVWCLGEGVGICGHMGQQMFQLAINLTCCIHQTSVEITLPSTWHIRYNIAVGPMYRLSKWAQSDYTADLTNLTSLIIGWQAHTEPVFNTGSVQCSKLTHPLCTIIKLDW